MPDLPLYHCLRCHHSWYPRKASVPQRCPHPKCGTPWWNQEYTRMWRVTSAVLKKMADCRFELCQQRLTAMLEAKTGKPLVNKSTKQRKPKRKQIQVHETTRDNLPEGFVKIGG